MLSTLLGAVLARLYVVPSPAIINFPILIYLISGTFVSYVTGSVLKAKERERALRTLLSIGDAVISVDTG